MHLNGVEYQRPPLNYYPQFLAESESSELLTIFETLLPWRQEELVLFGRQVLQPRLICFVADANIRYAYSNKPLTVTPWIQPLLDLKIAIEALLSKSFNCVLCNLYRNGTDSMGWHSDDEKSLGKNPVIASVSLGAARTLRFKEKAQRKNTHNITLNSGSLLVMLEDCQNHWVHALPKTTRCNKIRINLTFRKVF